MKTLANEIRAAKYKDEPRYWSLRDSDWIKVRALKTHRIAPDGKVVPL